MTDFAKPDSLPFRSYYFQQRRKKRKAANALVQRYITSLSAAASMFYQLSEPVVIGAGEDFEIEVKFATTEAGVYQDIFCSELKLKLRVAPDGYLDVAIGNGTAWKSLGGLLSALPVNDGEQHTAKLSRTGDVYTLEADGSTSSSTVLGTTPEILTLGKRSVGDNDKFTGEIYDLKIWTGGDRNTGTLLHIPIDEDWKTSTDLHDAQGNVVGSAINVTENEAEFYTKVDNGASWLGEELVVNGGFDSDTNWIKGAGVSISDGSARFSSVTTANALYQTNVIPASTSNTYRLTSESYVESGTYEWHIGGLPANMQTSESGVVIWDLASTSSGNGNIISNVSGFTGSYNNVSVKRLIPIAGGA